mmetsp:Transcript_6655/g.18563  ORF Transcript_6655/g.18563 Transcript_6655/m.18563 type:complete len:185 (+) Transcript_6655:228-782(+)
MAVLSWWEGAQTNARCHPFVSRSYPAVFAGDMRGHTPPHMRVGRKGCPRVGCDRCLHLRLQALLGSMPGVMAAIVALLQGVAGEDAKAIAVELLHRLVARNNSNRTAFVAEKGAVSSLVGLLKGKGKPSAMVCDTAWVVGILSTSGSREDLLRAGAQKHLQQLANGDGVSQELKAAIEFALRSL